MSLTKRRVDSADPQLAGGWGGSFARAETEAEFDALPVGVKRLYWYAPYKYTAAPAYDAMRRGGDMREFVRSKIEDINAAVRRESLALYGAAQEGWL